MNELELKFRLDPAAALRWQQLFKAQGAKRLRLRARYFDTADTRLAAASVALRLRLEGRRWVQTLKAAGDSAVHRLEHEVAVPSRGGEPPALDITRHEGSPALDRLRQALGDLPATALEPRYETDVQRSTVMLRGTDGSGVEAALDIGKVVAGKHEAPIVELELEHVAGPAQAVFQRAQEALGLGGIWLSTISKAEQGERLRQGGPGAAVKAAPLQLPRHATGATLLRSVLHSALAQILPNTSVVAEGRADSEHIHQARVGLRRLRTALRELSDFSPHIDPAWEPALAATFSALGESRDSQAVADAVQPLLEAAGAPKTRWTPTVVADPVEAVRAPEFQRALVGVLALAHAGDEAYTPLTEGEVLSHIGGHLKRLHRQVLKDGQRFMRLPIERQHRVRKRAKRLRYLSEFAWPLWPARRVERYLDELKPVQDALGHHADCAVAAAQFTQDALADPAAQFAAGYLTAHLAVTGRAAHQQLRRLAKAEPYWKQPPLRRSAP